LARIPGVQLISLQKGAGTEQLRELKDRLPISVLCDQLDEEAGAFMDTAAIMQSLDLVITPDTATAHLAGGLGVPVWLALSALPDWRWMWQRDDSPWYPSMRLFRQDRLGDWRAVFERMATEIARIGETRPLSITSRSSAEPADCISELASIVARVDPPVGGRGSTAGGNNGHHQPYLVS
jgi:hypothetical protein